MHNRYKVYANIKTAVIFLCVIIFITLPILANNKYIPKFPKLLTITADTIPAKQIDSISSKKIIADTLKPSDSLAAVRDTTIDSVKVIALDTTLFSKDSLDAPVSY